MVIKAPSYGDPCRPSDLQSEYFTPEGARDVVVTWTPPKATDENGNNTIARYVYHSILLVSSTLAYKNWIQED